MAVKSNIYHKTNIFFVHIVQQPIQIVYLDFSDLIQLWVINQLEKNRLQLIIAKLMINENIDSLNQLVYTVSRRGDFFKR